jgi:hypothetical protein
MADIAIEHGPLIVDLPIKMVIFHSYVNLPEGNPTFGYIWMHLAYSGVKEELKFTKIQHFGAVSGVHFGISGFSTVKLHRSKVSLIQ